VSTCAREDSRSQVKFKKARGMTVTGHRIRLDSAVALSPNLVSLIAHQSAETKVRTSDR